MIRFTTLLSTLGQDLGDCDPLTARMVELASQERARPDCAEGEEKERGRSRRSRRTRRPARQGRKDDRAVAAVPPEATAGAEAPRAASVAAEPEELAVPVITDVERIEDLIGSFETSGDVTVRRRGRDRDRTLSQRSDALGYHDGAADTEADKVAKAAKDSADDESADESDDDSGGVAWRALGNGDKEASADAAAQATGVGEVADGNAAGATGQEPVEAVEEREAPRRRRTRRGGRRRRGSAKQDESAASAPSEQAATEAPATGIPSTEATTTDGASEEVATTPGEVASTQAAADASECTPDVAADDGSTPASESVEAEACASPTEDADLAGFALGVFADGEGPTVGEQQIRRDQIRVEAEAERARRREQIEQARAAATQAAEVRIGFGEGLVTAQEPSEPSSHESACDMALQGAAVGEELSAVTAEEKNHSD